MSCVAMNGRRSAQAASDDLPGGEPDELSVGQPLHRAHRKALLDALNHHFADHLADIAAGVARAKATPTSAIRVDCRHLFVMLAQ
jgi:hypothetical protein